MVDQTYLYNVHDSHRNFYKSDFVRGHLLEGSVQHVFEDLVELALATEKFEVLGGAIRQDYA